jgi:uncharacterized protein (TIGR04255 family)
MKASSRSTESEVYVNSPLVETIFEIQFPGEPAVECRRDRFYALIRAEFPRVAVPNALPGQAVALQPYHYQSADGQESVMVAINRFAYATRKYPGFAKFAPRALDLAARFCRMYELTRLNRTGLRYVNLIPFLRESGVLPWKRHFTVNLTLPATSVEDFVNVGLMFESRCKAGTITTRIAVANLPDKEAFVLDFDFAKMGTLLAGSLGKYMNESHDHTKRIFGGLIADEYKAVMRGELIQ